jgi:hypothetical protein
MYCFFWKTPGKEWPFFLCRDCGAGWLVNALKKKSIKQTVLGLSSESCKSIISDLFSEHIP